jgi:hypothetical protein
LINSNGIDYYWSLVVDDIKNNTYPNRQIIDKVFSYFASILAGIRELRTQGELIPNPTLKQRNRIVVDNKFNSICYEMVELLDYWKTQFLKKSPLDAEELLINKIDNYSDGLSFPTGYLTGEFTTQNGLFIEEDNEGFGLKRCLNGTIGKWYYCK